MRTFTNFILSPALSKTHFKNILFAFKSAHSLTPAYLSELLQPCSVDPNVLIFIYLFIVFSFNWFSAVYVCIVGLFIFFTYFIFHVISGVVDLKCFINKLGCFGPVRTVPWSWFWPPTGTETGGDKENKPFPAAGLDQRCCSKLFLVFTACLIFTSPHFHVFLLVISLRLLL